jgi:hypothetical protein
MPVGGTHNAGFRTAAVTLSSLFSGYNRLLFRGNGVHCVGFVHRGIGMIALRLIGGTAPAGAVMLIVCTAPALASVAVPAPIVGAGPYGLVAAALGYGGYHLVKYLRTRR